MRSLIFSILLCGSQSFTRNALNLSISCLKDSISSFLARNLINTLFWSFANQ